MNHTSPSIAHHSKSVPASRNAHIHALTAGRKTESFAQFPRRPDRDAGKEHREQRLIGL